MSLTRLQLYGAASAKASVKHEAAHSMDLHGGAAAPIARQLPQPPAAAAALDDDVSGVGPWQPAMQ